MEEKILEIFQDVLGEANISLDTVRNECAEWDSASHLIILSTLEDELNIEVPIDDVPEIISPRDFLKYVK